MKVKVIRTRGSSFKRMTYDGVKTIVHNSNSIGLGFFDGRVVHLDYGSIKKIKVLP